jgi:D-3-phosphoglycerate dehydrogenase
MKQVLVTEPLASEALDAIGERVDVDVCLDSSPEQLLAIIGGYDGLIVRSGTQVTADLIQAGNRLQVIGRAGIGVDNIDLAAATRKGIVVVNVPSGNTIAVAEHTIGLLLGLARHIPQGDASLRDGRWDKKYLTGVEVRGKTLGLVGFGRIGSAVAHRALCLEMQVIAHDPFVSPERADREGVRLVSLDELLRESDFISLHTPLTAQTRGLIDAEALAKVKSTARIINCARGGIVDEKALLDALQAGQLAGAALDVFVHEPLPEGPLTDSDRVILTPHLGAATKEAKLAVSMEVVRQVADILEGKLPRSPVNAPFLAADELADLRPYLDLARRLGCFYAQIAGDNLVRLDLTYAGDMAARNTDMLRSALLVGLLSSVTDEPLNLINAAMVAQSHGIKLTEHKTGEAQDLGGLLTLSAQTTRGERVIAGAVLRGEPHILRINDYWLDFVAEGLLLVTEHREQPGIIGRMGTLLGDAGINIHFVQVGRQARGGPGVMVLGIDDALTPEALDEICRLPSVRTADIVDLDLCAFDQIGTSS